MDRITRLGVSLQERLYEEASRAMSSVRERLRREDGQGSLEYVMIIALVVIVIFGLLWLLKDELFNVVNRAVQKVKDWASSTTF